MRQEFVGINDAPNLLALKTAGVITAMGMVDALNSEAMIRFMAAAHIDNKLECRFTLDGSILLEARLEALCQQVRLETLRLVPPSRLDGLVLGGGYGRGHGGVLKTPHEDAPYNDLEFYVFIRGNPILNHIRYIEAFQHLTERLSPVAGLHVEFKVDSLEKLRRGPVSIFSYDLLSGHRLVHGNADLFWGCEQHLDARRIVPSEATRLLLNRCSGLLLVKELLLKPSLTVDESDFIGRNLAKAKLALGDALLVAEGLYHWDCRERGRRLASLAQRSEGLFDNIILKYHAEGIEFKLHPVRSLNALHEFDLEHRKLSELALQEWLWIENGRLKTHFASLRDYSFSSGVKCGESRWWHNVLSNIRTFGVGGAITQIPSRYPRERLFNALPLLLGSFDSAAEPVIRRHLQKQLQSRAEDWQGLVRAYKHLWNAYG